MEEAKEKYTKALKKVETELDDAKNRYEKSMDSLPNGWSVIGLDLVQGITESLTSLMNGMTSLIARPVALACYASMKVKDTYRHVADKDDADEFDIIEICSRSPRILRSVDAIGKFIQEGRIDWNELYDQQEKKAKTDLASAQLEMVKSELKKCPSCKQKSHAEDICKAGVNICKKLRMHAPAKQCSAEETEKILSEWESLNKKALAFDSESKCITNSPALTQASPMMNKVNNAEGSGKTSASQRATELAYFRIEETRAQLNKARECHEKCVEKMENNEKELAEVLSNMRRYNIEEIDFNTTIKILIQGMDAMGRVQEQWQKMVRFFEMISHTVGTQSNSLLDFQKTTLKAQQQSYDTRLLKKDMIYKQAFQASNIASLVHMISETYTCVSDKHLMHRIGMLSTLITMDNTKPDFQKKIEDLRLGCEEAQKAILREVCKCKEDFDKSTAARLERIETELLPLLPAAEPEQIKAIKEAVDEGFKEDTPECTEEDMSAYLN
ncbi:uncharacterized protein LOC134445470 [Engraulis encrasicolus]|uniref:uncharacterized protein LOC134445470 n=1 Tax=Engraulis encrasicolus TaxID=184585 RepID=UPI002FD253E9